MSPRVPHMMPPPNDPNFRRSPPGSSYPQQQPPPQHVQNSQPYAYHPGSGQNIQQRPAIAEQLQMGDPAAGQAHGHPIPLTMGAVVPQEPPSHSMVELGRRYTLDVVQQPKRARMCGFGDKDRRPITPPPCVRIVITDAVTGAEIDTNEIGHSSFVLNVDLWSADGLREVNLVHHSTPSSTGASYANLQGSEAPLYPNSLSAPTGSSNIVQEAQYSYHYNPQGPNTGPNNQAQPYNPYPARPQVNPYAQAGNPQSQYGQPQQSPLTPGGQPPSQAGFPPPPRYSDPNPHHAYYNPNNPVHHVSQPPSRSDQPIERSPEEQWNPSPTNIRTPMPTGHSPPTGMFTRNLIGSLAASAFRLTDPNDKIGIWFVLQDLSVRTEGTFRLRFSFVNVGPPSLSPNGNPVNQLSILNTGKAPILASCFSDVFQVYSAKKFPGVVESTGLSRCFANQGIKIPIRKDGPGKVAREEEYEED